MLLDRLEVLPGEFVREPQQRLVLFKGFLSAFGYEYGWGSGGRVSLYQEQVAFWVEFCGCEFGGHGGFLEVGYGRGLDASLMVYRAV